MELTPRKLEILRRVVEEYVATGQPVGSKALVERSRLDVSSSTVRSELFELEAIGLLTHPHTSAGRIPTQNGYRVYTEELVVAVEGRPAPFPLDLTRDAQRARGGDAAHDRDALGGHAPARAGVGSRARGRRGATRRGAAAPTAGRHRRRHHRVGGSLQADLRARRRRRPGAGRLGAGISGRDDRRQACERERRAPRVRGPRAVAPRAVVSGDGTARVRGCRGERDRVVHRRCGGPPGRRDRRRPGGVPAVARSARAPRCRARAPPGGARPAATHRARRPGARGRRARRRLVRRARRTASPNRSLGAVGLLGPLRMDYEKAIRSVRAAAYELSRLVEDVYGAS